MIQSKSTEKIRPQVCVYLQATNIKITIIKAATPALVYLKNVAGELSSASDAERKDEEVGEGAGVGERTGDVGVGDEVGAADLTTGGGGETAEDIDAELGCIEDA